MPDLDFTVVDPADYIDATWDDQNGKPWRAHANGMWYEYAEPITGGTTTFAGLTDAATASIATINTSVSDALAGKQPLAAVLTGTTASFTTALASKLDGIEVGATGDQDLSGLLTISTAASTYAPISHTHAIGTITGLGTNVATALAINADATGGIFRQGQALSATTVTASGAVSALRHNAATYGDVNGAAFTSGYGVVRYTGGGTNRFYFGPSDDTTIRRSSAGVLDIDSGTNDAFRDLRLRNLTASGTVTAAGFIEGVVAIGNSGTAQTIALTSGTFQTVTLTGNCTFTMPTATAGRSFMLKVMTGAGGFTGTFTGVKWPAATAPTITAAASKYDLISFVADGTAWSGSIMQNYSV